MTPRDTGKLLPIRGNVFALPSRNRDQPHVVTVFPDRSVACTSCQAAVHGRTCWAAGNMRRRLARRKPLDARELLTVKERVYNLLLIHRDARDSDKTLIQHYFRDYHDIDTDAPWGRVLDVLHDQYKGYVLETIRRRRAEWQAAGFFPACDEILADRIARESSFRAEFGEHDDVRGTRTA